MTLETNEKKKPYIHGMLDVSTAHLTVETLKWLEEQAASDDPEGLIVYQKEEYGYFIPIVDDSLSEDRKIPDDMRAVIEYAQGLECTWIMLDRDGFMIDQLPVLYVG